MSQENDKISFSVSVLRRGSSPPHSPRVTSIGKHSTNSRTYSFSSSARLCCEKYRLTRLSLTGLLRSTPVIRRGRTSGRSGNLPSIFCRPSSLNTRRVVSWTGPSAPSLFLFTFLYEELRALRE